MDYKNYIEKLKNGYELRFIYKQPQTDYCENYWTIEVWRYDKEKDKIIITYFGHDFITEYNIEDITLMLTDILKMEVKNEVTIEIIKKEKCPYCTGRATKRKPLMKNNKGDYSVVINSCNYLEDSVVGNSVDYSLFGERIKFCPMCGRKL